MLTSAVASDSRLIEVSMADHRANIDIVGPPTVLQRAGRTEPDLHLIKQVEQVTRLVWKDRPSALPGIPSLGITDAAEGPSNCFFSNY